MPSEEELKKVMQLAAEIADKSDLRELYSAGNSNLDIYLESAKLAGIPGEALMEALRQHNLLPSNSYKQGDLVFAQGADSFAYVAEIADVNYETARVNFLNGGGCSVSLTEIQPVIPGRSIEVLLPNCSSWLNADLLSCDLKAHQAHFKLTNDSNITLELFTRIATQEVSNEISLKKIRTKLIRPVVQDSMKQRVRNIVIGTALLAAMFGTALGFILSSLWR